MEYANIYTSIKILSEFDFKEITQIIYQRIMEVVYVWFIERNKKTIKWMH